MAEERFGIDFGTSTTLAARGVGGGEVVPLGTAERWVPTVASVASGQLTTGEDADRDPEWSLVRSVKTSLTTGQISLVRTAPDGAEHDIDVDAVITAVLRDVKARAEKAIGSQLDGPVQMACPAIWNADPRRRLHRLARTVGLNVTLDRILDEPIAAGISWVMDRFRSNEPPPDGRTVVFDYGGGTLDVAVLEVTDATPPEVTVLAASGLSAAGDSLDALISGDLEQTLSHAGFKVENADRPEELRALLRLAARRLKVELSDRDTATSRLAGSYDQLPELSYSRGALEAELDPMLDQALKVVVGTLRSAELRARNALTPSEIRAIPVENLCGEVRYVLLAGGMSKVPRVAARMRELFPNAVVAHGASASSRPEESIVRGLVQPEAVVSDLNLHRPGFDFKLRFANAGGKTEDRTVYAAFTPLYQPHEIAAGMTDLGHWTKEVAPPWADRCFLRCEAIDGTPLDFRVDGTQSGQLEVEPDRDRSVVIKLYADGRLLLKGRRNLMFRVERWPHIRSRYGATVSLVTKPVESNVVEDLGAGWWPQ